MKKVLFWALIVMSGVVISGCGKTWPEKVVSEFLDASMNCELERAYQNVEWWEQMIEQMKQAEEQMWQDFKEMCKEDIQLENPSYEVKGVEYTNGEKTQADVSVLLKSESHWEQEDKIQLKLIDGKWKISSDMGM